MSDVAQAMKDAWVQATDERGLVPLGEARAVVAAATAFGPWRTQNQDRSTDRLWAALLSLEDAAEFVREASRIEWLDSPRGMHNVAPFERYGAAILPWLRGFLRGAVLRDVPWCVAPCLARIGTREAFEVALAAETLESTSYVFGTIEKLVAAMVDASPQVGWPMLAERALAGDARAAATFERLVKGRSRGALTAVEAALGPAGRAAVEARFGVVAKLEAGEILALFDQAAARGDDWPRFRHDFEPVMEYSGLRLVAARGDGDRWGVALERITGGDWDHFRVERFVFGSEVTPGRHDEAPTLDVRIEGPAEYDAPTAVGSTIRGPAGALTLTPEDVKALDLRPGRGTEPDGGGPQLVLLRAWLARFPGAAWPPVADTLRALRLDGAPPLVVTDAFQHAEDHPGAAKTYKTLADAIVRRDPARFAAGKSNTDWRKHLVR